MNQENNHVNGEDDLMPTIYLDPDAYIRLKKWKSICEVKQSKEVRIKVEITWSDLINDLLDLAEKEYQ